MKKYFIFLMSFMVMGIVAADNKSALPESRSERKANKRKSFVFVNLKIIFSGLISEVEGKLNGSKLYKGRNNFLMTNKVKPKNANTTAQASVRASLREYASTWKGLTEAQRKSWNSGGSLLSKKNKIGTAHSLSGFNYFVAENQRSQLIFPGSPLNPSPLPAATNIIPLECSNPVVVGGATPSMVMDLPEVPTGEILVIYATPSMSAGRYFVKGQYRPIYRQAVHAAQPAFDLLSAYTDVFGTPVTDSKIHFEWETCSESLSGIDKFFGTTKAVAVVS